MVIRYRGTSPKLGSCQGECPYQCDYVLGGGEVGVVDDVGLSPVFQGIVSHPDFHGTTLKSINHARMWFDKNYVCQLSTTFMPHTLYM